MKARLALILTLVTLLTLVVPWAQAFAQQAWLEIAVTNYPRLVFDGDRVPVTMSISNTGDAEAKVVTLRSSTNESKDIGNITAGITVTSTFYLNKYNMGVNQVEVYAECSDHKSDRWKLTFEVRPPSESISLQVLDAPASIYQGSPFEPQLRIQNLWQQAVNGALIKSGDKVLYNVGTIAANTALTVTPRIEDYKLGANHLDLVAQSEKGTAATVPLDFNVIPADQAVKVFLSKSTSPIYKAQTLEFHIVVAASQDVVVNDLELKAITGGVSPRGYFLGDQVPPPAEVQPTQGIDITSLLYPTQSTAQTEEPETVVEGSELYFEARDLPTGTQPLRFEISYRVGGAVVQREFAVDATVLETPAVHLIQAEQIEAAKDKDLVVTLHVANRLPVTVQAVSVMPLTDIPMSPTEFFIGEMAPDDFLPAYFKIASDYVVEGKELSFKLVYRVGTDNFETAPLRTVIHIEEEQTGNAALVIVPIVVVVLIVVLVLLLRRRRRPKTA